MGLIRFLTPGRPKLEASVAKRGYIVGMDEIPWQCRIVPTDDGLIIDRPTGESCSLRIPWQVEGHGELVLATGSLLERQKPYLLEVELARGTLNRVRNQLATREAAGMRCPPALAERLAEATCKFAQAATRQQEPSTACAAAREALLLGVQLTVGITQAYAQQALAVRHRGGAKMTTLFGANLGTTTFDEDAARHYLTSFNAALAPMRWTDIEVAEGEYDWKHTDRQMEWCQTHKLKVLSGPLLSFDRWSVPDWSYLFEGEAETISGLMESYVKACVERYAGRVQVWQCAARMNVGECLSLPDETKFSLALRAMQLVRAADPRTPIVVSFDMPWGEYVRNDQDLPMHLADALVRANLGLSGIGIELNMAYSPGGSLNRDPLEINRQIDRWALLGLPLLLLITVPSDDADDDAARRSSPPTGGGWNSEAQQAWVRQVVPMLLAKQAVQGIFWRQFRDDEPHDFPHGGLLDAHGHPKPALKDLAALRAKHLN